MKKRDREHPRLIDVLEEAVEKAGSRVSVARSLGLTATEISDLINGRRFVTVRQALRIQQVLGVSAREILLETCATRIDDALDRARRTK